MNNFFNNFKLKRESKDCRLPSPSSSLKKVLPSMIQAVNDSISVNGAMAQAMV